MTSLRQRIRSTKICCQPWKQYKGEIKLLCVSAQCLFANNGLPWDVLEMELKGEGWLQESENLWDIMSTEQGLKRTLDGNYGIDDPFDETWTDEDYEHFYGNFYNDN